MFFVFCFTTDNSRATVLPTRFYFTLNELYLLFQLNVSSDYCL